MKKRSKKVRRKVEPKKVITMACAFFKMEGEFFFILSQISEKNVKMVDDMEKVILSDNSINRSHLIFFLNALCYSSRRRINLLKFKLDERNPELFKKLVEFGFKDQLSKSGR